MRERRSGGAASGPVGWVGQWAWDGWMTKIEDSGRVLQRAEMSNLECIFRRDEKDASVCGTDGSMSSNINVGGISNGLR